MQISGIGIYGCEREQFSQTNNCPGTLAATANCVINVTFTPTTGGALAANLSVSDSAPGSPQIVSLTGTGVSAVSLSPAGLSFRWQINTTSSTPADNHADEQSDDYIECGGHHDFRNECHQFFADQYLWSGSDRGEFVRDYSYIHTEHDWLKRRDGFHRR